MPFASQEAANAPLSDRPIWSTRHGGASRSAPMSVGTWRQGGARRCSLAARERNRRSARHQHSWRGRMELNILRRCSSASPLASPVAGPRPPEWSAYAELSASPLAYPAP
uniref:Uncharacterized protein n=1 Tax=Zea mays TaxID=4577 RepID=C4J571_MAIZE|nr:unknown [Zea mays]|eukprot:NP_001183294.1 uncharacterized protein LOC100501690 [Zea mays]